MRLTPIQIRKSQRLFSVAVLIMVMSGIAYCLASEFKIPTLKEPGTTKLMIVYECIHVGVNDPAEITVRAVDDEGIIDTSRDDLIQLNITSLSYPNCRAELSTSTLTLKNGTVTVILTGQAMEMVKITVSWKEGESELKPNVAILQVGSFE